MLVGVILFLYFSRVSFPFLDAGYLTHTYEKTKANKKAEMDTKKNALRAEDIAKGVFVPVSAMPKAEPKRVKRTA